MAIERCRRFIMIAKSKQKRFAMDISEIAATVTGCLAPALPDLVKGGEKDIVMV